MTKISLIKEITVLNFYHPNATVDFLLLVQASCNEDQYLQISIVREVVSQGSETNWDHLSTLRLNYPPTLPSLF